jgi:hypothetical protein
MLTAAQSGKAFVIMQIGDHDLDNVYHQAIEPADGFNSEQKTFYSVYI